MINNLKEWCDKIKNIIKNGNEANFYAIQKETEITLTDKNDYNIDYCNSKDIPIYNRYGNGGCIVHSKDNLSFGFTYDFQSVKRFHYSKKFYNDFVEYLNSKHLNALVDKNDILIDDFKVASGAETIYFVDALTEKRTFCYFCFQFNINNSYELIKHICVKSMNKIPKGLSEYGISSIEVYNWCKNWLENNVTMFNWCN